MRARGYDLFLIGDEVFWKVSPVVQSGRIPFPLVEAPQPARFLLFDAITSYNMYENGAASQKGYAASSTYVPDVAAKYSEYLSASKGRVYFVPQIIPGYNDRGVRMTENHYAIPREWREGAGEASLFAKLFDLTAFRFVDPRLNMILITSWNEWNEDTAIEPLEPSGPTRTDTSPSGKSTLRDTRTAGMGFATWRRSGTRSWPSAGPCAGDPTSCRALSSGHSRASASSPRRAPILQDGTAFQDWNCRRMNMPSAPRTSRTPRSR